MRDLKEFPFNIAKEVAENQEVAKNIEKDNEFKVGDIVSYPIEDLCFKYTKKHGLDIPLIKLQVQKTLINHFISKKFEVKTDELGITEIVGDIKLINKEAIILNISATKIKALYLFDRKAFIIYKDIHHG